MTKESIKIFWAHAKARKDFFAIQEISFIVNMLNREFNKTCREKNHFLFHWNTLMSSGQLIPIYLEIARKKTNWWLLECRRQHKSVRHGRVSRDSHHWRNSFERICVVRGEIDKNPNDITSRSHVAWSLDKDWRSRSEKRNTRMGNQEMETRTRQKNERSLFYWSEWRRIQRHHLEGKAKVGDIKGSCNAM